MTEHVCALCGRPAAPADEAEPITLEELEAAFADSDVFPSVRHGQTGVSIDTYIELKTRSDLRLLCRALGITLEEPS